MQRRLFLTLLASSLTALSAHAQAPAWPQKSIRMIVAAPAGSAPDIVARIVADKMGRALGQSIVIDNRPGAGGIIAMNLLKAAPPDGYTIGLPQAAVVVVTPFTYKEAAYEVERDFEAVAMVGRTPMMFVANPNNPARTLGDAVAQARAKPEQVSVGNPTRTSIPHLASELAGLKSDVKFQQVSFANTAQGLQAVVNGDIQFYVDGAAPLLPLVKAGKLRGIAVASEIALPGLEDYPVANQSVPGINVYGWFTLLAPKGTPAAIVQRLNTEANTAQQQPDVLARFRDLGTYATPGSVADAAKYVRNERDLFGGVIKSLGLKPE